MNFGKLSRQLQRLERAKAKLIEFTVSPEERTANRLGQTSSDELLFSTIRVLSQFSEAYINDRKTGELYDELTFIAQFYESYAEGEEIENDYFFLLTGAIANILSDNFGNAKSLISKIDKLANFSEVAGLVFVYITFGLYGTADHIYLTDEYREEYYFPITKEINNIDDSVMLLKLKELSNKFLKSNDHEAAFLSLMLCAIHKKLLENAAVRIIPKASNSSLYEWKKYFSQRSSIHILWQAQRLLLESDVLKGKSATIQLPTGVGKTKSIELIISAAFLLRSVNLTIVVAPLRALCNEIEKDLQQSLQSIVNITALSDVLNTDEKIDLTEKRVIVLTPEKLSFLMRHNSDIIQKSGLIIFDEAHMFDDRSRGATYEMLIMRVKEYLPNDAQKVFISAVMPNAEELNEWLTGDGVIVADKAIKRTEKSVGFFSKSGNRLSFYQQADLIANLDEMVYIPQICPKDSFALEKYKIGAKKGTPKTIFPEKGKPYDVALFLACRLCNAKNCAAIYVNQPKSVFSISKTIMKLNKEGYEPLKNILVYSNIESTKKIYNLAVQHFGDEHDFVQIMALGIFPHFGDLENGLRVSIEYEIRQQNVICVICTSTLAEGVNLPIRYLLLTSLNDAMGQLLSTRKFQNLIGRTARSGIHTEGSLICTSADYIDQKISDKEKWNQVITLFDPTKSEQCSSAVLQVFNDLKVPYTGRSLNGSWLINEAIKNYEGGNQLDISKIAEILYNEHVSEYVKNSAQNKQIDIKKIISDSIIARLFQIRSIIETLESFVFDEMVKEDIVSQEKQLPLAERTLAYKLASDEQKPLIENLFDTISKKVATVPKEKREAYSKTMNGIDTLKGVDAYIQSHKELYATAEFDEALWINAIIDLSVFYLSESSKFRKLNVDIKSNVLKMWINEKTYKEILEASGLTLQEVIKMCQKDMGYAFNLLMSCVLELLQQYKPVNETEDFAWDVYISKLTLFQQRIKYGLLSVAEIAAYEFGYADRIVAGKVGEVLYNKSPYKTVQEYKATMKESKDEIKNLLTSFPDYFSKVIRME